MEEGAALREEEGRRWYACYTRARHEKRVDVMLRARGVETYLPLVSRLSQWKDRKQLVDWPMFPSYVFARTQPEELHGLMVVPGVSSIVRNRGEPVTIRAEDLENVRRFAEALRRGTAAPEPVPYLAEGQWVEVVSGPFEGVRGVVVEHRNRRRVRVGLKAIGQGMEVDVEVASLKPIEAP